jgi:hypothetical protein
MQDLYLPAIKWIDKKGLTTNLPALMLTSGAKTSIFPESKGQVNWPRSLPARDDDDYRHIGPPTCCSEINRQKRLAATLLEMMTTGT